MTFLPFLLIFAAQSGIGISDLEGNILVTTWLLFGIGIDPAFGLLPRRRRRRRFREIAADPLSKEAKTRRAEWAAALSFRNQPLNSTRP